MSLEGMLGSKLFLFIVSYSLMCSHLLIVLHSYIVYSIFNSNIFGYLDCSFGFSSVLYSLKYICSELEIERNIRNPFEPQQVCILPGIYVPAKFRYVIWIELLVTKLIYPQSSFTGHLCGIFAGIIYMKYLRRLVRL